MIYRVTISFSRNILLHKSSFSRETLELSISIPIRFIMCIFPHCKLAILLEIARSVYFRVEQQIRSRRIHKTSFLHAVLTGGEGSSLLIYSSSDLVVCCDAGISWLANYYCTGQCRCRSHTRYIIKIFVPGSGQNASSNKYFT